MKKLLAILMIVSVFTACNSSSDEKTEVKIDPSNTESPLMDAVNTADSVNKKIEAVQDSANMQMQ